MEFDRLLSEFSKMLLKKNPSENPENLPCLLERELCRRGDDPSIREALYVTCCTQLNRWGELARLFNKGTEGRKVESRKVEEAIYNEVLKKLGVWDE